MSERADPKLRRRRDPAIIPIVNAAGNLDVSSLRLDVEQVRHILPDLIDAMTDAVLVVDRERRVVAANRRYVEVFGALRPDVVGNLCHEAVLCPEGTGPTGNGRCAACAVVDLKTSQRLIRSLPDPTGAMRRWEVTLSPVVAPGAEVSHVVEVWRDVTDRSQLESQLSHSERLASLGMLAAGVAHEINNPMASILAGVESLRRWLDRVRLEAPERTEAAEVLDMVEEATCRSHETTAKLLLLAQPYHAAASWSDLNRAARDTLSLLQHEMKRLGIRAVEDLDPELPAIWARDSGMRGVWMNLCMNAVQAMTDGGTLTVRTRRDGPDFVVLEVIDSGPGIHPAHHERIWDPFFTTKQIGRAHV